MRNCPVAENYCAQLSCCSKLASKKSAQLSFFLKLATFVENLNLCAKHPAQLSCCWKLASKRSAQLTFYLKLATFVKKLKLVQNSVANCAVD